MTVGEHFEEQRQAVPVEVNCTDKRSHRIKSSRIRGHRRLREGIGTMSRDEDAFHTHINPS